MKAGVRVRGVSDYVPTYSGFYGRFDTVFIFIVNLYINIKMFFKVYQQTL